MQTMRQLTTVDEVLEHLGGNKQVQQLTGVRTPQAVWEWKNRGVIAARFYLVMTDALARVGCQADPRLWGQAESADQATERGDNHASGAQQ